MTAITTATMTAIALQNDRISNRHNCNNDHNGKSNRNNNCPAATTTAMQE